MGLVQHFLPRVHITQSPFEAAARLHTVHLKAPREVLVELCNLLNLTRPLTTSLT